MNIVLWVWIMADVGMEEWEKEGCCTTHIMYLRRYVASKSPTVQWMSVLPGWANGWISIQFSSIITSFAQFFKLRQVKQFDNYKWLLLRSMHKEINSEKVFRNIFIFCCACNENSRNAKNSTRLLFGDVIT